MADTSIESDKHVGRADALRDTPAAVRFISADLRIREYPVERAAVTS